MTTRIVWCLVMTLCFGACQSGSSAPEGVARALKDDPAFARLVAREMAASQTGAIVADAGAGTTQSETARHLISSPCLAEAQVANADRTLETLLKMDALMADYVRPSAPDADDAVVCLTAIARTNHPDLVAGEQASLVSAREAQHAALEAARAAARTWDEFREMDWTWDPAWATMEHIPERVIPAVFGCWWTGGVWQQAGHEDCVFLRDARHTSVVWRERVPARTEPAHDVARFTRDGRTYQPELTRRVAAAASTGIDPAADAFCVVATATIAEDRTGLLRCLGGGDARPFEAVVPAEAVALTGALHNVGVGDVVRLHGHGKIRKVFGPRASNWRFESIPVDGASIVARSTCCSQAPAAPAAPPATP